MTGFLGPEWACTESSCIYHGDVNYRARKLQAEGPDEYPFGYYQWLAYQELRES